MALAIRRAVFLLTTLLGASSAAHAQPVSLSAEGIGQVLIYPYYTVRNGWTTLLSIVNNDSANGRALKLRFLEGKNGASVASVNLFLAPNDVWTAAVLPGSGTDAPPQLVTNDTSCTYPALRPGVLETGLPNQPSLVFDTKAIAADGDAVALQTVDRLREGYFEVIEMADIPATGDRARDSLAFQIKFEAFNRGQPPCTDLSDGNLTRYTNQIAAPSGGLSGAATLLNALGGASAEYTPTTLNGFWLTPTTATLASALTASTSSLPNLSSGGNTMAHYFYDGKTYFSKFNRSIDAVSAILMSDELLGEHAYTVDSSIATTWVITAPTKRFYTQGIAARPFAYPWDGNKGAACTEVLLYSYDRNTTSPVGNVDCSLCPPLRPISERGICQAAAVLSFAGINAQGGDFLFDSKHLIVDANLFAFMGAQNAGASVARAGREGGKTRVKPDSQSASLQATSGSITIVDLATGQLNTVFGPHTLYGLPMIGVAFSQSAFKTGNPQQNYASGFRLQSTRRITTP